MHIAIKSAAVCLLLFLIPFSTQAHSSLKHRLLISTDIGGTDPDDNQSVAHLLMYSNEFDLEGLISSPSFGDGNKGEILRMIDVYEKDLPKLNQHISGLMTPEQLRPLVKQGRMSEAPACGYGEPTEGSDWIVKQARKDDSRPLYVLVWGCLEDVAQALHDAPDIATRLRVHWIGGPNKKWGINAYCYIVENFPDLWMIENNTTYRGFIYDSKNLDEWNADFFKHHIKNAGHLGRDFAAYYKGNPKLGDTPSLLYMMQDNPENPEAQSWGGKFVRTSHTPRTVFYGATTAKDTAQICGIIEWQLKGPKRKDIAIDSACITLDIRNQKWKGYYKGHGLYVLRHSTYYTGTLDYTITSTVKGFKPIKGLITIENTWDVPQKSTDLKVGKHWWTDSYAPEDYWHDYAGANNQIKVREEVMRDWAKHWEWLRSENTFLLSNTQKPWDNGKLQVSENLRFLQFENGKPFFWQGETAWLMPERLNRDEVAFYLKTCQEAGYNVVQVQVLNDVPSFNIYGAPSHDQQGNLTGTYWDHMDYIIDVAAQNGIYIGMVCIWGGLVKGGKLSVEQAKTYGTFLANRYKDRPNIIWFMGGDIEGSIKPEVWNTLATTIKQTDKNHLMTYHPRGRYTSARWWSKAEWIDLHTFQSGHRRYGQRMGNKDYPIPDNTEEDNWMYVDSTWTYNPIKPVLDAEPIYEDIPQGLHVASEPLWQACDVRRYAYWSVFAGSCGHTYGHNAIMQFYREGYAPAYHNKKTWTEALRDPGFNQMQYLKQLMLSFPYFERIPDQSIVLDNGTKYDRLAATRGTDYLLVYNYTSREMKIDLRKISGNKKSVWWMNASTGQLTYVGEYENRVLTFRPPETGDGVLIAIDIKKDYLRDFNKGVKTVTVFKSCDQSDHYANQAVLAAFKGRLYCMWQSSPRDEDSDDTRLLYSWSTDEGLRWSAPVTMAVPSDKDYCTSGGWLVRGDTLTAYIDLWEKSQDIRGGRTYYRETTDGKTWSQLQPVMMADDTPMDGILEQDPYRLKDGRIIGAAHFQPGLHVCPIYTDDPRGISGWHKAKFDSEDRGKQSRELEPSQYVRPDGTIVMLFRDQASSFRKIASYSTDRGETWTRPVLTDMPDARTKQCAGNLPDGTPFIVSCPSGSKDRWPLVLLTSSDGTTFDKQITLRSREDLPTRRYEGRYKTLGYSYPKAIVANNKLYISYSTNKEDIECTIVPLKKQY